MADTRSISERDAVHNRAQKHFAASEQRDTAVRRMIDAERAATDAKTAKLRALRLAKEEADRALAPPAAAPQRKSRAKKSPL